MKKILFALLVLMQTLGFAGEEVHLWGTEVSPYVRKVVSVLEEKQIPYTLHPILPSSLLLATGQQVPEEFTAISPLGKIPALQVGTFAVSDSSVIGAYIEKKWPNHPLYPENPEDFAKTLWYERYADTTMTEVFHKLLVEKFVKPNVLKLEEDRPLIEELISKLPTIFEYLEGELKGRYLVGSKMTIADIAVAHHFASLRISGIEVDLKDYPHLSAYVKQMFEEPAIQAALKGL